jgi:hypothetical protein
MAIKYGGRGFGHTSRKTVVSVPTVGTLTISTAPTLAGDPVVGQRLYATNGTYSAVPDSYTMQWYKDAVAISGETADNYLVVDGDVGSVLAYKEIAVKSGYTSPAANPSANTAAVTDIDLTSAITAFTRTSSSGVTPMTFSVTFAANVYSGYQLRARVYSDSGLSTLLQDVSHELTGAEIAGGALDLAGDGLTAIGATDWLQLSVFTTSPNSIFHEFVYPDAISPTDVVGGYRYMKFNATALNGWYHMRLREFEVAESIGGANIASGKTYTFSNEIALPDSVASVRMFDNDIAGTMGVIADPGPFSVIIDFGVAVNPVQIRLHSHGDYDTAAPNTFTLSLSTDNVTYGSPVVSASGVTWTPGESKTWSW